MVLWALHLPSCLTMHSTIGSWDCRKPQQESSPDVDHGMVTEWKNVILFWFFFNVDSYTFHMCRSLTTIRTTGNWKSTHLKVTKVEKHCFVLKRNYSFPRFNHCSPIKTQTNLLEGTPLNRKVSSINIQLPSWLGVAPFTSVGLDLSTLCVETTSTSPHISCWEKLQLNEKQRRGEERPKCSFGC